MKIRVKITREENAAYFNCNIDDIVDVEFEEYVAAVVASELASGNLEACKAQAVASRTFAISRGVLNNKPISDSSSTAQAYRAPRYNSKYQHCIDATNATAGQILWYGKSAITSVYTASNGGRTVSSLEKWGSARIYLPAQDDPWDIAEGQHNRWGHGVGMSQRGCKYAAKQGFTYIQILEFYYPNTTLKGEYGAVELNNMNEKANKVVEAAKSALGYPYVFGAWGELCTPANRRKRARSDHPTIVSKCPALKGTGSCANCKWNGALMYDCRGFTHWCLEQVGISISGSTVTSQYKGNNWALKGEIKDMPNLVCCVFQKKDTPGRWKHTGLHIGDGKIIHCQVNVQNGATSNKAWTHFAIPKGLYSDEEIREKGKVISMPILKKGSVGDEVRQLQEILNQLGYDCGVADGKFGDKTRAAVIKYQETAGLTADGVVGAMTWAQLLAGQIPMELAENELTDLPQETIEENPIVEEEEQVTAEDELEDNDEDSIALILRRIDSLEFKISELAEEIKELSGKKVLGIFKFK